MYLLSLFLVSPSPAKSTNPLSRSNLSTSSSIIKPSKLAASTATKEEASVDYSKDAIDEANR